MREHHHEHHHDCGCTSCRSAHESAAACGCSGRGHSEARDSGSGCSDADSGDPDPQCAGLPRGDDDRTCGDDDRTCKADDRTCGGDDCTCGGDDRTCGDDDCTCKVDDRTCGGDDRTCGGDDCTCGGDDCTCGGDDCTCGGDDCTCKADDCTCKVDDRTCGDDDCTCKVDDRACGGGGCSCGAQPHSHERSGCGCGCGDGHDHAAQAPFSRQAAIAGAILIVMSFILPIKSAAPFLAAAGTLAVGYPLFLGGVRQLARLEFDELGLLTIAVAASFGLAAVSADPMEGTVEAMAVTVLFRIGSLLEAKAVAKSRRDIEALVNIRPDTAVLLLPDGSQQPTAAGLVAPGSLILLKAGDRVPIDCEVVEGTGYADLSAITGEPLPLLAERGTRLPSGAINSDGLLTCRTVASFEDSAASRIIRLVSESENSRGSTERLISRFARVYTPAVILLAAALAVFPPLLGFGGFGQWLSRALVFLVASCPCALVISVPLTFFAGIGLCSRFGVLIKGARCIEQLARADRVAFDKTGTVTLGKPVVGEMILYQNSLPRERLLALAAAAEKNSAHPAAKAIVSFAGEQPALEISGLHETSGMGVSLFAGGERVLCGSLRLMQGHGVDCAGLPGDGVYLAVNGVLQCRFTLTDLPREEAALAVAALREIGVAEIAVLTGDSEQAARRIAQGLGVTSVYSQLLPEQKPQRLLEMKAGGGCTLFVGDGINDAPVLAAADVGVAMGLGSDAAIEAADVVLVSERLTSLPRAISAARKTVAKANQNIIFAVAVKLAVLLLGALGMAAMWMAVFADVGVTILAVLNSLTLLRYKDR